MCRSKPVVVNCEKGSMLYCAIDDVYLCKLPKQQARHLFFSLKQSFLSLSAIRNLSKLILLKKSQILLVPFIFFICTTLFNILEITKGKNHKGKSTLHSNPSQILWLVIVIKNLKVIQL